MFLIEKKTQPKLQNLYMIGNKLDKILVTGAAGMIGGAVIRGLLFAGYSVIGVDRKQSDIVSDCYTHLIFDLSDSSIAASLPGLFL